MVEIHAGVCGNHVASKILVENAMRQGFYWATLVEDAIEIAWRCEGCQYIATSTHVPSQELRMIPMTWPFATWGLDIMGPFKKAPVGFTHLFVATDKFTKWIEAKAIEKITSKKAVEFVRDIITRFGTPHCIITDNGAQFTCKEFQDFADDLGVKVMLASVTHHQSNGQVERANGMILHGFKPRIFDSLNPYAGKWVRELPAILWGLRTNVSRAT